jgi:chromosome segregation ATPase
MKQFQQNLLIILSLSLCGLCAWQWYAQTVQRKTIGDLNQMVYDRNDAIQGYTNSLAALNDRVNDMGARIVQLKATAATNQQVMAAQSAQIAQLRFDNETLSNEIGQYQVAVGTLESRLSAANTDIDQQNGTITKLLSQRNDLVQKYDELATNRNDIVIKFNALEKQMEGGK